MSPRGKEHNEAMRAAALKKITRAALEEFADHGFHGTSIKKVAKKAGMSYGLVYHYFPTKEKLFFHLVDTSLVKSYSTIDPPLEREGTAWQKLEYLSESMVRESFSGDGHLYFIIMVQALTQGKAIPGMMEYIGQRSAKHYEKFIPVLMQAQLDGDAAPGNPAVLAASYFAYVQGLALLLFQQEEIRGQITPEMLSKVLKKP